MLYNTLRYLNFSGVLNVSRLRDGAEKLSTIGAEKLVEAIG